MQIEPAAAAFAQSYADGRPQVVWTTLVADLETPVSAFLKLATPPAAQLPAGIGRRRRDARALLGHRARSGRGLADERHQCRDQPRGAPAAGRLRALRRAAARGAARLHRREPHRHPGRAAADGGRHLRLSRLRHGAADRGNRSAQSRSDRLARRDPGAAHHRGDLRRREGHHHGRDAGPPRPGDVPPRPRWRAPPSASATVVDDLDRALDKEQASCRRPAGGRAAVEHDAGRIPAHGARRQGLHRGRRYFPGRAVAALRGALRAARLRALSRHPAHQPGALPVLPRLREILGRRLEPGNPGAGARRHGDDPADRRHAAARRDAARGQGARSRAARRSEGMRRAPHAARPRPQRRRPRRPRSAPSR